MINFTTMTSIKEKIPKYIVENITRKIIQTDAIEIELEGFRIPKPNAINSNIAKRLRYCCSCCYCKQ